MIHRKLVVVVTLLLAFTTLAGAQSWAPLNHQPTFRAGTALLLTNGTVMVQEMTAGGLGTGNWWRLTPDSFGSYRNGTWSQLATMPVMPNVSPFTTGSSTYAPLYYASAVLPDGRIVIIGGEYDDVNSESTRGAIYTPLTNTWATVTPPQVAQIGDASGVVLPDGTFMMGPCCGQFNQWLLNASALSWTSTGTNKTDANTEEGWTLLPNGNVLTIDTAFGTNSEIYNPASGSWSSAGSTMASLPSSSGEEIGPAVLRPDGTVFAAGGNSNTALFDSTSGSWSSMRPQIPNGWNAADVPAALLPNGHVLIEVAEHFLDQGFGTDFFEYDGSSLSAAPNPPNAGSVYGFVGRMLVLPTGEILFTNQTNQVQLYTSSGTYLPQWQPSITSVPFSLGIGTANNSIFGTQFNGLSQGAMYGDDAQAATNYPLVRITNNATGHVFYARTHDHSTMAVATGGATVSTLFDVPGTTETGDSTLQVVVNGIPSNSVPVSLFVPRRRACCTF